MQRLGDGHFDLRIRVTPFAKGERHGEDPIEQIPQRQEKDSFVQVSESQAQDPFEKNGHPRLTTGERRPNREF